MTDCTPVVFTIPIAPVTKKNHGNIVPARNGRKRLVPSKPYKNYERAAEEFLAPLGIDRPVNVKALYYTKTKRKVDLCNLHAALHDVLVKHGVLADDNSAIVAATDGSRVFYDKDHPRTEVEITRMKIVSTEE
jgi:Holliday junction resolvase RusA-like endonuclease